MDKKMKNKKNLLQEYSEMHGKRACSRRDFLSAGALGFSGMVFSGALPQVARAADGACPSPSEANQMAPFITLNLAGGAMLASNFVPMDQGGQPLPSYNNMGLGNGAVPIEREFGNVPFAGNGISKLLTSLRATASADTISKTAFVGVNVRSRDDSSSNPFDVSGLVAKAGLVGEILPNLGRRDGETGIRQQYSQVKPPSPLIVNRYEDLEGAVGAPGTLGTLNQNQRRSFFRLVKNLSDSQLQKISGLNGGATLSQLVKCATGQNIELSQVTADGLDVRTSNIADIWTVNGGTASGDQNVVFGSMTLSALMGSAGTVGLEMGGYDYHNKTRTRGDQKDGEAGVVIGKILETANRLQKKVFLYVSTDGSCRSAQSEDRDSPWTSDRGSAGCVYMIAFDPAGRPETSDYQLGHFTTGQAADDSFLTGGSVELASTAVFANYLKFSGQIDRFQSIAPGIFDNNQLQQVLRFG